MSDFKITLICLFLTTHFVACSGGSSGIPGSVRVGQIGGSLGGSHDQALMASDSPKWGDVAQSSGDYAWARVDGLRLTIQEVFGSTEEQRYLFGPIEKELEIGGDVGAISIQKDIVIPPGNYTEVGVSLANKVAIKAFCRTDDKCLYTTTSGIEQLDNCNEEDELPDDYDFYQYKFLNLSSEKYFLQSNKLTFSISEGDAPHLTLLIDPSYIVTCSEKENKLDAKGQDKGQGVMPPFLWDIEGSPPYDYFSKDSGNFGVGYIPLFTYFTKDPNEKLPVGETYAASGKKAEVIGDDGKEVADLSRALITTIAFDANGKIIAARSRNFDADHQTDLEQGWSGFTLNDDNTYSLLNGEHYAGEKGDYSDARWLQDREITGFKRTKDFLELFEVAVADGPECGKKLNDYNRECLGESITITTYWKRIMRY